MLLENVFCALVALMSVLGAVSLVYTLLLALVRPKQRSRAVVTVRLSGSPEAAVQQVSYLLARLSVAGAPGETAIAAVCADPAVSAALNNAFRAEPRVVVCGENEFASIFLS